MSLRLSRRDYKGSFADLLSRLVIHRGSAQPKKVTEGLPFLGFMIFPRYRRLKLRKGYYFRRKIRHQIKHFGRDEIKPSVQGWLAHLSYGNTYSLRKKFLSDLNLLAIES